MANDFTGDSSCVALYRFEDGALAADSKGTNTLTAVNTPTVNTTDKKEGSGSTALVYASHQFYKITDANLNVGFPLKSGDATQQGTICFYCKPASYASNSTPQTLIGFPGYSPGSQKFFAVLAGSGTNNLILYWGYASGASFYTYDTGIQLGIGAWWHIAIRIDGVNTVLNVRAWKYSDNTQKTYAVTPASVLSVPATEFRIGGTIQSDTAYSFDGLMDECVVFNCLKLDGEIDSIRNQAYPPPPNVEVDACGLEVGYKVTDIPNDIMVIATGLEVGYKLTLDVGPPAPCRSLTTVGTCPIAPPANCRSLTTVKDIPLADLNPCRSLSRVESIAAPLADVRSPTCAVLPEVRLEKCSSPTICQPLLLAVPHACVSKTRMTELPPFNDGLFLIF